MATVTGTWIAFKGNYSVKLDQITAVYGAGEQTRIILTDGSAFYVPEPYDEVMKAIYEAAAKV